MGSYSESMHCYELLLDSRFFLAEDLTYTCPRLGDSPCWAQWHWLLQQTALAVFDVVRLVICYNSNYACCSLLELKRQRPQAAYYRRSVIQNFEPTLPVRLLGYVQPDPAAGFLFL
jgi:hypothetical protein